MVDKSKDMEIPIVHCCSGDLNPIKWGQIAIYLEQFFKEFPLEGCVRIPSTKFHINRTAFLINFYLKHYYPAYALDFALRLSLRKPKFIKICNKVWRMIETLHYFTNRGWKFESDNIIKLWNCLSEHDQKTYNFDVRKVDWDSYLFDYLMGMKTYLLREKLENLPKARVSLSWARQISFYTSMFSWALVVQLFAWRRTRKTKWSVWLTGVLTTYALNALNFRPQVHLKTIEEYRKTALPVYA